MGLVDYSSDDSSDEEKPQEKKPESSPPPLKRSGGGGLNLPAPKNRKKDGPRTIVLEKERADVERTETKEEEEPSSSSSKAGGISAFLPTPKNRPKPQAEAEPEKMQTKSRVLGGGLKPTFDGEVSMEGYHHPSTELPENFEKKGIVPASVLARRAKYGDSAVPGKAKPTATARPEDKHHNPHLEPDSKPKLPNLFSFGGPSAETKPQGPSLPRDQYQPVMLEREEEENEEEHVAIPQEDQHTQSGYDLEKLANSSGVSLEEIKRLEGRHADKHRAIKVVDFNVDEFYQTNQNLQNEGRLEESKRPVQTVASGKHQLKGLVESAQRNKDGLEEMFTQNKRNKSESGSKYGF